MTRIDDFPHSVHVVSMQHLHSSLNETGVTLVHLYSPEEDPFLSAPQSLDLQKLLGVLKFGAPTLTHHSFLSSEGKDDTCTGCCTDE